MSLIYSFQTRKIDGRCLISVESDSGSNQPIYLTFEGSVDVNHLMTLPAQKSFTAILECSGEIHFPESVSIEIKQVSEYCRFDYKVINESEVFELPVAPELLDADVAQWGQVFGTTPNWITEGDTLTTEQSSNDGLTGIKNNHVGIVRNGVFSGEFRNEGNHSSFYGLLNVRDNFSIQFTNSGVEIRPTYNISTDDHYSANEWLEYNPSVNFMSWTGFKILLDGDLISVKVWGLSDGEPDEYDAELNLNELDSLAGIDPSTDLENGHVIVGHRDTTAMRSWFRNLKYQH